MFRKSLLLGVPVLIALGTALAVFGLERQRTPDWKVALDDYLARTGIAGQEAVVSDNAAASRPWKFVESNANPQLTGAWPWGIDALPYPPDALQCVLLDKGAGTQLIYVAHHTDKLWRVGWVVHLGPSVPLPVPELAVVDEVGCALGALHS